MILRGRLTALPLETPVPNDTPGEIRLEVDDSLVTTVTTTDGWYEYEVNGNPGPYYVEWDYGGVTHKSHSKVTGSSAATDVGNLPLQLRAFSSGIISGVGGGLLLTAAGGSMNVTIADGAAMVYGILYDRLTSGTLAVSAAHATLGRLDYVVVEVVPRGAGEDIEGRSVLKLVNGTASGSPALPALTQTSALYQQPIGYVTVGAAVTTIASDKVTPVSTFVGALPKLLSVTSSHLAADSVTAFAIAADAVGASELANASVASANIIDGAVTSTKIGVNSITATNIVDGNITSGKIGLNSITSDKIVDGTIVAGDLASNAITTVKVTDLAITEAKLATAVQTKLNAGYTGVDTLMPGSGFVATGSLSSGTRTLITMAVGPLLSGVTYAVQCQHFCTLRGTGSTGTVNLRTNVNGGTQRELEIQHVGGVPRGAVVTQSEQVVGAGVTINVTASVVFLTGDPCDVRAGEISVLAIPT